ncbi:MAG: sugar ABC transporter substrate-binding protein [Treponema sp.]|jgi:multiple sugar transport system substrate-binding protein|nr:sugar ABC transporter substrate-binding protein [Treponema sp.]
MNKKAGIIFSIIFICLTLTLSFLAGCGSGSSGNSADGKVVTITCWKPPHTSREEEIWNNTIALFSKDHPDIKVEFLAVPWESHNEKEMAAFSAGTPPDVSFQVEQYVAYAAAGKLLDLNGYASVEKLAGYPKGALDYCTYRGQLMGIPFIALNSIMFYNKDIFAAEGITKLPSTWDELLQTAQACTKDTDGDGKIDQFGILFRTKPRPYIWAVINYIQQAGADLWNADTTNIGFNTPAGVAGLQFYTDLFLKYRVAPPIDYYSSSEEEYSGFYNGKIAMYPDEIQNVSVLRNGNPNLNLGAFLLPKGPAPDDTHANWAFANMGMLSIASDSPNKDAAWTFVEYATRPEIESQYLSQVGFFSPQMATNRLMYQDDEIMQVAAPGIAGMQTSPASPYFEAMFSGIASMEEKCIRGAATPAEAIRQLEGELTALTGQ